MARPGRFWFVRVSCGTPQQAWSGMVCFGEVCFGKFPQARHVMVMLRYVQVGSGTFRCVPAGEVCFGVFRLVRVRPRRLGLLWCGPVGCGVFPQAWYGLVMLCDVCCGTSPQAGPGAVRSGRLRYVPAGMDRCVRVRSGRLRYVLARHRRHG